MVHKITFYVKQEETPFVVKTTRNYEAKIRRIDIMYRAKKIRNEFSTDTVKQEKL